MTPTPHPWAWIACLFWHAFSISQRISFLYLMRWHAERMKTLNKQCWPNGGIAWVYRLVLPTGRRGLFHNVLSLSPYLELRERFPYLTHSCKSQLNSSNSENELQTRLLSIWAQRSCQGWGRLRDHPLAQIYWPRHHAPVTLGHTPHTYTAGVGWSVARCVWLDEWGAIKWCNFMHTQKHMLIAYSKIHKIVNILYHIFKDFNRLYVVIDSRFFRYTSWIAGKKLSPLGCSKILALSDL